MSYSPNLELDALLRPIADDQPAGIELPIDDPDGLFPRVKDAYEDARKIFQEENARELSGGIDGQGQPWRTIPDPDWDTIIELSQEILSGHCKDLRVAAWLTDALLHKHQLNGLLEGLTLCCAICEQYWTEIVPSPTEEDGHTFTVGGLASLFSNVNDRAIQQFPVVRGKKASEREEREYSALDYEHAKTMESLNDDDERSRLLELGYIEMSEFRGIADVTDRDFFADTLGSIEQCIEKVGELGSFLNENCQDDEYGESTCPAVFGFKEKLEDLRRLVHELAGDMAIPEAEPEDIEEQVDASIGESPTAPRREMTRETAFQQIEQIASFFEKTEPHTPVHFALRQAVRWGRMPLNELLTELVEDVSTMDYLRRMIGLPQPPENEEY